MAEVEVCEVCGARFRRRGSNRARRQPTCGARACVTAQQSRSNRGQRQQHEARPMMRLGQRLCECGGPLGDQRPVDGCRTCQAKTEAYRDRVRHEERGPNQDKGEAA